MRQAYFLINSEHMKMNKSVIYTGKNYAVQDENNFPEL